MASEGPVLSFINKRLQALQEKLNRVTQVEKSLSLGKTLTKEQEEVFKSKPSVVAAINELQKLRSPLAVAVEEEIRLANTPKDLVGMTRKKRKREEIGDGCFNFGSNMTSVDKIVGNEDLLTEILLRVPTVNTIRRVSKSWLKLTLDPQFCYKHNALNPKVVTIIYYYFGYKLMSLSLNGHKFCPSLSFLQGEGRGLKTRFEDSCNGLILCAGFPTISQYSVCNLTTQKINIIPKLDKTNQTDKIMCLAFDPVKSPYYKVLKFVTAYSLDVVDIYSSETKSWRHVNILGWKCVYPSRRNIYWDGAIHWLQSPGRHLEFDVDREILKETLSPKKENDYHCFGECNGYLLLVLYGPYDIKQWVRIFMMKQGTRHWVVKESVNLKPVLNIDTEFPKFSLIRPEERLLFRVMNIVKEGLSGEDDDIVLVLVTASKFFSLNLRTKALKVLAKSCENKLWCVDNGFGYNRYPCCQFFESLYPV